jgi:hypothetical protein
MEIPTFNPLRPLFDNVTCNPTISVMADGCGLSIWLESIFRFRSYKAAKCWNWQLQRFNSKYAKGICAFSPHCTNDSSEDSELQLPLISGRFIRKRDGRKGPKTISGMPQVRCLSVYVSLKSEASVSKRTLSSFPSQCCTFLG